MGEISIIPSGIHIDVDKEIYDVRPYVISAVVRNVNFT